MTDYLLKAACIPLHPTQEARHAAFCLYPGECIHLKGRNGAGKSTFLKALAGYYHDELFWLDSDQSLWIPDNDYIASGLTARNYLKYMQYFMLGESAEDPLYTIINFDLDADVAQLSLGQKQQLNLCQLYLSKAKVWLLDEPDRGLDQDASNILESLIEGHIKKGGGAVVSTHSNNLFKTSSPCIRLLNLS
ncbi:ATP-binding cassette domain-containing protein [Candidatus Comchoanobacter bicostacola]|uniref:ATP-binding cassette domain-containing protein n=1 Tax=Candidatus Comchoanobacter bicostacola TaxID=2919598 RepID=A0ABY5DKH9_9GAMM|nr:ATP-binding cassette domain-containing protein [Candidatus Comchoanobacter bicostacola]UTC24990.1 ATP-binding cassette domain-containing protein [Candidatus Comchoanobacter bicostacola]